MAEIPAPAESEAAMLRGFDGAAVRDGIASRLGLGPHEVLEVREHPAGCVVELRDGPPLLVTDTVARRYVPEVDDVEPVRATEPDTSAADAKPAPRGSRPAARKAR